jgi:protein-disulfide isomerase
LETSVTNARTVKSEREKKAAELRAQAARREARRRTLLVSVVVAVIVLLVVGITVIVRQAQHDKALATASAPGGVPANLQSDGGIVSVTGTPPAGKTPVTVELWEDFQCPACRAFESANDAQLEAWAKQGVVKLVYKPVAFLDQASTTDYSTRALIAAAAVVDSDPAAFTAFHDLLYTNQPEEGSAGLTDTQLADLAVQAGAPRDVVASALSSQQFKGWTVQRTDEFTKKFTGTPTVLVDGKEVKADGSQTIISAATLRAAVAAAAKAHGLPAPK